MGVPGGGGEMQEPVIRASQEGPADRWKASMALSACLLTRFPPSPRYKRLPALRYNEPIIII